MEKVTANDVRQMLQEHFRRRSDLGLWNSVVAAVLEPQNPFAPLARRKPKLWFVITFICSFAGFAAFIYFNFWN
jgi:hypothetical protein